MAASHQRRWNRSVAVLVALTSILGLDAACDPSPPKPSSAPAVPRDADGAPVTTAASPRPEPTFYGVIQGTSIAAITAAWTQRWKVPIELHGFEYSASVEAYPDDGRFSVGAIQAKDNRTDQARVVFCVIVRKGLDDQATRHALVDGCLAAALQGEESQTVPAWIYAQTAPNDGTTATKRFPRFTASIRRDGDSFGDSLDVRIRTEAP